MTGHLPLQSIAPGGQARTWYVLIVFVIFQRRALQRRLDELRAVLDSETVDGLAARLNRAGRDRLAAMWEVVVLHGLSRCGALRSEVALASGRRPDIHFEQGEYSFTGDVTTVSDEGLDRDNPFQELSDLIESVKSKLDLPIGGLDLQVRSKVEHTKRGRRSTLRIPPRKSLAEFVRTEIAPRIREQAKAGTYPIRIEIDNSQASFDITIDPTNSPYSSGGYPPYSKPSIKDRNPLYSALRSKAEQLRGAEGLTGIIVGDGGCDSISGSRANWEAVSTGQIVSELFRQYTSIDFVLVLSVDETRGGWALRDATYAIGAYLFVRDGSDARPALESTFNAMLQHFPNPTMTPVNGAHRAREDGYGLGFHGGYSMSVSTVIRLGLREFTEIFAGIRTLRDQEAKYREAKLLDAEATSHIESTVLYNLRQGRLPESIEIIKGGEDENDDWVEIRFGKIDPAISPLR